MHIHEINKQKIYYYILVPLLICICELKRAGASASVLVFSGAVHPSDCLRLQCVCVTEFLTPTLNPCVQNEGKGCWEQEGNFQK